MVSEVGFARVNSPVKKLKEDEFTGMSAATRRGKFFAGTSQTGNPQSGAMATAAANFNIPPPATFNP